MTVAQIFGEWYTIPSYQRNYVWESDQINDMLNDFEMGLLEHPDEEYFMGSFIIQNRIQNNDLLDGQQRITTLFLLFAFLRDYRLSSEEVRETCQELVFQKEHRLKGIPERLRLDYEIRGQVKQFIEQKMATPGSITAHWDEIVRCSESVSENYSIQRMCNTLVCFKKYFETREEIDLDTLLSYILRNVVMIYISANSLEDAFRLFSIMNDRGQRLRHGDILKASNLEKVEDERERSELARNWENMQASLGDDLDLFLGFVRTMILKDAIQGNLLDEFNRRIFAGGRMQRGREFFHYVAHVYQDYQYAILLEGCTNSDYCSLIRVLQKGLRSSEWVPVVLAYYHKYGDECLCRFVLFVARKFIADLVCAKMKSMRISNMVGIIRAIEQTGSAADLLAQNRLFAFDTHMFIKGIQSDAYGKVYTRALMMLLELKYKDRTEWKEFGMATVEHILPRNPSYNSQWCKDFTPEQRKNLTNKLGNFCLLNASKNASLSNLDYSGKLTRYIKNNIGAFAYTQRLVLLYPQQWTPAELAKNQCAVVDDLMEIFGLLPFASKNVKTEVSAPVVATKAPKSYYHRVEAPKSNVTGGTMYRLKAKYPNAYKFWNKEEDNRLLEMYQQGRTWKEISVAFGRNVGALKSRLRKMTMPGE